MSHPGWHAFAAPTDRAPFPGLVRAAKAWHPSNLTTGNQQLFSRQRQAFEFEFGLVLHQDPGVINQPRRRSQLGTAWLDGDRNLGTRGPAPVEYVVVKLVLVPLIVLHFQSLLERLNPAVVLGTVLVVLRYRHFYLMLCSRGRHFGWFRFLACGAAP